MSPRKTPYKPSPPHPEGLSEAIEMLQSLMRRTIEMVQDVEELPELVDFMEKYSQASTRLANLMRAQRDLNGEQGLMAALQEALAEVVDELSKGDGRRPASHG